MKNPTVINAFAQSFNGKIYKKRRGGRYYRASGRLLHRDVWSGSNGDIPDGFHVHHMDNKKANNGIEILDCMSMHDHRRLHGLEKRNLTVLYNSHGKAIKEAAKWHKSEAGREWHAEHWEKNLRKMTEEKIDKICEQCGGGYQSTRLQKTQARFCSNGCKSQHRRLSGIDDIEKTCGSCRKKYMKSKYIKSKYCSLDCSRVARYGK